MYKSILIAVLSFILTSCYQQEPFDEQKWRTEIASADSLGLFKNNYQDQKCINPWLVMKEKGGGDMFKWWFSKKPEYPISNEDFLPQVQPLTQETIKKAGEKDFFVWLGHYSYLLRINGQYLLLDPILSNRAFLPLRLVDLPIKKDELSTISNNFLTLITHNHYDHLDISTLEKLPDSSRFIVPIGVKEILPDKFIKQTSETNWWQCNKINDSLEIITLPAQHWSRRIFQSAYKSLWCGYLIVTPSYKLYFSGDTGYFIGFKAFREKFGAIDYAFLSIGPADPRWLMHYQHMNVSETLEAFDDLQANKLIPGHWGTFDLGDDPPGLTAKILEDKIKAGELDKNKIHLPVIGKIYPLE